MKKKISALFLLSLAATAATALAFANNAFAVFNWWKAFLAVGGDSSKFPASAPGFLRCLDWTVVDYSAVTTFIPALGCLCITLSLFRLLRGKRVSSEDFPFFRGSDQLNVALGLLGTLWGIIVIGYFKLDAVTMADLMMCLHTALFSTLSAVVWVFLIDRPLLRPFFAKLLGESGLAEADDGDLSAAVDRLVERLGAASDAFDARQKSYEAALEKRLADYQAAFEAREKSSETSFENRFAAYQRDFEARQKEYAEFFSRRIAELESRAAEERARADSLAAKLSAVASALR